MKKLQLSNGNVTLVDDEDYTWLSQWSWHEWHTHYAIRRVGTPGKLVWMHREINQTPTGMDTDHINRNPLDNRRCNLRTATRSQNILNSRLRSDNTTGYKGVYHEANKGRWIAEISIGGKQLRVARFRTKEEAIMARQSVELQLQSDTTRT